MDIPVLVEPLNGAGYRASTGAPLALSVEGKTEGEALQQLQGLLQERLARGKVVLLPVAAGEHPLARFAGQFRDDPYFEDVIEIMRERRRAEEDGAGGG